MKRCPQCNRVETDDALAFCRADGTALISDSSSLDQEAGTVKVGSAPVSNEIETSILPHITDAAMGRATAPTTMLPAQTPVTTSSLAKPKRRKTVIAVVVIWPQSSPQPAPSLLIRIFQGTAEVDSINRGDAVCQ